MLKLSPGFTENLISDECQKSGEIRKIQPDEWILTMSKIILEPNAEFQR